MTVPCLYLLQKSVDVQTRGILDIGNNTVSWLQVLGCHYIRLAVSLCNGQFAVLHSGAFVWSTSQHQND